MKWILLDGAQGLLIIPVFFIGHVIFTLFVEGLMLTAANYKPRRESFFDVFLANLASLITALFCIYFFNSIAESITENRTAGLLITLFLFYIQTVITEWFTLHFRNRNYPKRKLTGVVLAMNLVTYFAIFLVIEYLM